jgi:cobalt-zinc-cadmium efflux system outer membrane protein
VMKRALAFAAVLVLLSVEGNNAIAVPSDPSQNKDQATIPASSKPHSEPVLTLERLLDGVRKDFPLILAAEEERNIAEGARRGALGAFDLSWKTKGDVTDPGYYKRTTVSSMVEKPTSLWGLDVYAGYRLGRGDFAIYDGKDVTEPGGEARLGFNLPLLRNRAIDERRAGLKVAELGLGIADQSVQLKRIEAVLKASITYWRWVAAGKKLDIIRNLLEIAKVRDRGLRDRVAHGDIAEFEQKDNFRGLLQRENQLFAAERGFQEFSFELSLFLRTLVGGERLPSERELPKVIPSVPSGVVHHEEPLVHDALALRPEVQRIRTERSQAEVAADLADNQQQADLNVLMDLSKDVGANDPTRDPTELRTGVQIDIPLQRRKAEGKLAEAQAKQRKLDRELDFMSQRIRADVRDALSMLRISAQQLKVVSEELRYARELEEGERTRFDAGESTILIVNLREQATADSAVRQVDAYVQYHIAEAYLHAALGKS